MVDWVKATDGMFEVGFEMIHSNLDTIIPVVLVVFFFWLLFKGMRAFANWLVRG